ncbi:MAG: AMP-binding protein [Aeromicrobium sp.]
MYPSEKARATPDKLAVVMGATGDSLTYGELDAAANQLAHFFRDQGLERLDHVAFFMENRLELVVATSAAERTGLYYTSIDAKFATGEAAWIVNDSQAKVVVTTSKLRPAADGLPAECPNVERWIMLDIEEPDGPWEPYATTVGTLPTTPVPDEKLGASMFYSSGTTGRPKGIFRQMPDMAPTDPLPIYALASKVYQLREGLTYIAPGPMHHAGGQAPVGLSIRLGGTVIVMDRFDAETFLRYVETYGATHSMVVPTMLSRMLALPDEVKAKYDLSTLEAITHGAAPCPTSVKQGMIAWLGPIIFEYYGGSEANGICACNSEESLAKPGTVGKAAVGEVVIRDDAGNELGPHQIGEIWFRGATAFTYFNDDDKTTSNRTDDGSMSKIGDIGYVDEDGYLFLTDRSSFTIVSGGVNIYPQEVENVLANHPDVVDVAVIGVPNQDRGEEVKAVVELAAGVPATEETEQALIRSLDGELATFKWPRSIDFVDAVPRTATGKLDKRGLRERYWAGHSTRIV